MARTPAIAFYDSRAPLTERCAKLDRRLAGIAAEFAMQCELNRGDSALAQLQSGSYGKTYWGYPIEYPRRRAHQRSRTAFESTDC